MANVDFYEVPDGMLEVHYSKGMSGGIGAMVLFEPVYPSLCSERINSQPLVSDDSVLEDKVKESANPQNA